MTGEDSAHAPFADSRAFLESDGKPLARALVLTIALLLAALIGWMAWATVEEIVRAAGRIEPAGQVKLVNHPRGGKIAELFVHNGETVTAGVVLVRLDASVAQSEYQEILGRLQVKHAERARLHSEAHALPFAIEPEILDQRPDLVEAQIQLREARAAALSDQREALISAAEAQRNAVATAAAELRKLTSGLPLLDEQLRAMRELSARGLYPRLKLVAAEKQLSDAQGERRKAETELEAARSALEMAETRRAALESEWRSQVLDDLARVSAERDRIAEELSTQRAILESLEIRAPVSGVVLELAVTTPGQSIGPHEPILRVVPLDEPMAIEARVRNEDIGRVNLGMPGTIKIKAFDYLRHGTLEGRVTRIAADATPISGSAELSYVVTVETARQQLGQTAGDRPVLPGMMVDVELRVGERTILSYLTDRLWLLRDAAFKEG
jgi:membrane fusion protein, adhesin transport system